MSPARTAPTPALRDGSTLTIDNVATTLAVDVVATDNTPNPESIAATADVVTAESVIPATTTPQSTGLIPIPAASVFPLLNDAQNSLTTDVAVSPSEDDAVPLDIEEEIPVTPAPVQQVTPGTTPDSFSAPATQPVEAGPQATAEPRVISVDAGGEDLVQITFNGQSIVQVEDGNDQQIYRDIRTSGDVLRITGSAPFNILLGDAAATELSLNGNNIDFTSNIRIDNSVRLTIGL